ncbi:Diablo, mitochondrial [Merluccius polli]|uniref:Direct IAP-binding protein with low pI n=1 Tax=Merluccius polli TaxID=89951 RepID=A0AA47MVJ4_MERPO|nr:Diablo, mitochondrial [Merluccius polli]
MQAVRKCAVCATTRPLQNRADVIMLNTNMAALRRGAACLSFLRSSASVLVHKRKPTVQRFGRWTDVVRTSMASLSVGSGLCAVPFTQVESLSHDCLIKRAASLVTDSAGTYLSQTTFALIDALTNYAKAVHTLIGIQRRYLESLGKLTPAEEDSIWQVIIGQRSDVSDRLEVCKRFESAWTNALNLCEMAAEAAYTSGNISPVASLLVDGFATLPIQRLSRSSLRTVHGSVVVVSEALRTAVGSEPKQQAVIDGSTCPNVLAIVAFALGLSDPLSFPSWLTNRRLFFFFFFLPYLVFPGADQASITVRTHIQLAQTQVSEVQKISKDAEKKLAEAKVEEIQRMAEYTRAREEHELHEAYLRED